MLTLVVATAGALALTLIVALVVVLAFAVQTARFVGEAAAALEAVGQRAGRLAERFERIQALTHTAASEFAGDGT